MKKFVYRALALVLCLLLSVSALAEGMFVLPAEISVIRAEAFMGDESMTEAVVPDGARAIGERAFAYSALTSIVLPASLSEIAANAFEGCEGLVATVSEGSYAHRYCIDNSINFRLMEDLYSIAALMRDGANFRVTVSTDEICVLRVEVLKEDRNTVLHTVHAGMEAGLDYADISVPVPAEVSFPSYYVLRAVLVDGEGNALCDPFMTLQHTEAYEQFESETKEDYADSGNEVIDFGDCGFGVVADGAIVAPGTSRTNDHETFVIPGKVSPEEGDVVVVTLEDGTQEPVKVKSVVRNTDGTTTIVRDPDTVLSDLYDVFKLEGVADVGEAARNGGVARMRAGEGGVSTSISTGFTYGAFSLTVTGTAGVTVKAFYNKKTFGEDYIEQQTYITLSSTMKAKVTGSIKTSDFKDAFGNSKAPELVLYDGPIALLGAGAAVTALELKISIPLEANISASGEYTVTISNKVGYSYTTANDCIPIKENEIDHDFQIKGSFTVQASLKIDLKAVVLLGILQGGVTGQVGARVQGTANLYDSDATDDKVHGCSLCLDVEPSLFAEVKGNAVLKLTKKFTCNLLNVTLLSIKATPLGKWYLSIINDADSLFGGKLTGGEGKCPNYKYRVNVSTRDSDGMDLTGLPVVITKDGAERFRGNSPCETYLYDGAYNAEATFESGKSDTDFTVKGDAMDVVLKEPTGSVAGKVTDAETGKAISGAALSIVNKDDETVWSGFADTYGNYRAEVKAGSYKLNVSKAGYESLTGTFTVAAGQQAKVNAALTRISPCGEPVSVFHYNGHTYAIHNCSCTWQEAREYCQMYGGHLVTFEDAAENSAVTAAFTSPRNCYWIGLYGSISSGWYWITGESLNFENWAANEPNNDQDKGEGYVHVFGKKYTGGKGTKYPGDWNDTTNNGAAYASSFYALTNFGFICEWDEIV